MHEETEQYKLNSDSEEEKKSEAQEEQEETCGRCGEQGDETYVAYCQECANWLCILCEKPHQCGRCRNNLCEGCYVRHDCDEDKRKRRKVEEESLVQSPPQPQPPGEPNDMHLTSASVTSTEITLHAEETLPPEHNSSSRRRSDLDDPEAEPVEEEDYWGDPQGQQQGTSSSSSSSSSHIVSGSRDASSPKRRRLNSKTKSDETVYGDGRGYKRKAKISFEQISKVIKNSKKLKSKEFEDALEKQSTASLKSEPIVERQGQQAGAWSRVHGTHRRCLLNGILYCSRCGKYSIGKVEGLAETCTGAPTSSFQKAQLKKLSEGRHPVRGALTWPDGTSSALRCTPVRIDRYL